MDAIAALYGSDSSDSEDAGDAEAHVTERHDDPTAIGADGGGSSATESDADGNAPSTLPSRKRRRDADDSPPKWKRAFAHVDGNWPSHVKVEIAPTDEVTRLVDGVVARAQSVIGDAFTLVPMARQSDDEHCGLHLSLSRPFVLEYDQIEVFVEALRAALKWRSRFQVTVGRAIVLVNDDATRSFLALQVESGADQVVNVLKCVDKCMREFGLPTYYKDPIPHVSIASALGDALRGALTQTQLAQLGPEPQAEATSSSVVVRVASVRVIIGNKHFHIPLR